MPATSTLIHEGHDIAFDPLFNALTDVEGPPSASSTRDNIVHLDLSWDNLSFSVPVKGKKKKKKNSKNEKNADEASDAASAAAAPRTDNDVADITVDSAKEVLGLNDTDPSAPRNLKTVLKGVSGYTRTGQMLAIMGASGAGKSSLLNLLAGRITSSPGSVVTGSLLVNGKPRDYRTFKKLSAYVLQDDDMFGELTVREQLQYTARLRLPSSMSRERKNLRVEKVVQELGLSKVADNMIGGTTIRGISGGERKRVSIGTELVTDASVIFLDEPTSGLDAFNALNVMTNLRRLASNGRTVVSTIHQPRSSIFQLFDMLLLLSEGRTVYFGPARDAIPYFSALHFPSPESFNPADFFLDLVSVDPRSKDHELNTIARIDYLAEKHAASAPPTMLPAPVDSEAQTDLSKAVTVSSSQFERSWPNEFTILASRTARIAARAKTANFVRTFQTLFFSLVLGILWVNNGRHENIADRTALAGLFFFICINQAFIGVFAVIFDYPLERSVITRERSSASYRTSSYYLAKFITELPRTAILSLLFIFFIYFIVGLRSGFGNFLRLYLVVLGCSLFGESLGITASILTGNAQASAALCPTIIIIAVLFGGFFIQDKLVPGWIRWLKYISFVYYGFNAFAKVEYQGNLFGAQILESAGYNDVSYWPNIIVLFAIVLFVKLTGFLTLQFLRAPKFLAF